MQSSEDIQHNHNLIECNIKYDINSFLASPSISFNKPTKLNLIVADDHGVDDDSDKNITEKTNNNTNTVKYLNLAIPNCCPYDNDIVNVTTGGDQFINYSNNHNIKCNLNKINLFIISSVNTKIKVNLNSLTLRDERMTKIGWANDFSRIWPIDFIGGATSVINSSKTETLLGGLSPSVEVSAIRFISFTYFLSTILFSSFNRDAKIGISNFKLQLRNIEIYLQSVLKIV